MENSKCRDYIVSELNFEETRFVTCYSFSQSADFTFLKYREIINNIKIN